MPEKSFHFDLGDSNSGPVGFCVRVNALNKTEAVARLKFLLPSECEVIANGELHKGEYIAVYFNHDAIDQHDISADDDDEPEPVDLCRHGNDEATCKQCLFAWQAKYGGP